MLSTNVANQIHTVIFIKFPPHEQETTFTTKEYTSQMANTASLQTSVARPILYADK